MIKLKNITKTYGKGKNSFQALKGINLKVKRNEFLAIMGPSGSGKSTLMNIIGALDDPTEGQYFLNEKSITKMNDAKKASFRNSQIGFIFQRYNLLNRTNVFDNVALPGRYGGLKNLKEEVLKSLSEVGLKGKEKNKANELSGGQMQRVAIARALLMKPQILMADEPTGNLDTKTGADIMKLIQRLHKAGNTILLVTHEDYIAEYAERTIQIKDGKIISDKNNSKK